jgi:hypothetical protein
MTQTEMERLRMPHQVEHEPIEHDEPELEAAPVHEEPEPAGLIDVITGPLFYSFSCMRNCPFYAGFLHRVLPTLFTLCVLRGR